MPTLAHRNEVRLVGRLSRRADSIALPSGAVRVIWRLVVYREEPSDAPSGRALFDTINCGTWCKDLGTRALGWPPGVELELVGSLRRRFWRGEGAFNSRYEVEVTAAGEPPLSVPD